jgi:hypothetical protein
MARDASARQLFFWGGVWHAGPFGCSPLIKTAGGGGRSGGTRVVPLQKEEEWGAIFPSGTGRYEQELLLSLPYPFTT